ICPSSPTDTPIQRRKASCLSALKGIRPKVLATVEGGNCWVKRPCNIRSALGGTPDQCRCCGRDCAGKCSKTARSGSTIDIIDSALWLRKHSSCIRGGVYARLTSEGIC